MLVPITPLVPAPKARVKQAVGRNAFHDPKIIGRPNLSGADWSDPETARTYAREWYRRNVRPLKTKHRKLRA